MPSANENNPGMQQKDPPPEKGPSLEVVASPPPRDPRPILTWRAFGVVESAQERREKDNQQRAIPSSQEPKGTHFRNGGLEINALDARRRLKPRRNVDNKRILPIPHRRQRYF